MFYINLHTHHFSNNVDIVEIFNQYPAEFNVGPSHYSIGIHPWRINKDTIENELQFIEKIIDNNKCYAIGECGLDKRISTPFELQRHVFELQLVMAQQYKKPVVVHCVAAFNELIAIKNKLQLTIPMIIHGFSKNEITAKLLIKEGFYLSFGKYLMSNPALENIFASIPNNRIFLETDSSNFTIDEVYKKAAVAKNISVYDLQQIVQNNFENVFGKRT